jgi:hypothetical protein
MTLKCSDKRRGAVEACLAHNQKVGGSKPPVAIIKILPISRSLADRVGFKT